MFFTKWLENWGISFQALMCKNPIESVENNFTIPNIKQFSVLKQFVVEMLNVKPSYFTGRKSANLKSAFCFCFVYDETSRFTFSLRSSYWKWGRYRFGLGKCFQQRIQFLRSKARCTIRDRKSFENCDCTYQHEPQIEYNKIHSNVRCFNCNGYLHMGRNCILLHRIF